MEIRERLAVALSARYLLADQIGVGAMATVFRARDLRHDRDVALKVLRPELGASLGAERFLSEIRLTAKLQHPHILPLFDSGAADDLLYYVMPLVDGESLRDRLRRDAQLPLDEALRISVAVANALEYAHKHGVVHRDLKPDNILLHAGEPVVADFGIALALSHAGGARLTQTGISVGTPQYMSPEQATGQEPIDGRSDVYSLGVILFEMLAGEPPFTGSNAQAVIARALTERPVSVRRFRPRAPEHIDAAIQQALEKLPADRFNTASQLAEALQGRTGSAGRARNVSRPWQERLRDPVVLGLAVLTLVALPLTAWIGWDQATSPASGAVRFPITVSPNEEIDANAQFAVSPDGRLIAFTARDGTGTRIYVRDIGKVENRLLAGTERALLPFFSPDGQWVGFITTDGRVKKVRATGGPVIDLAALDPRPRTQDLLPDRLTSAAWVSDTAIVVSPGDRLYVVPAAGGPPRPLLPLDSISGETAQRSPRPLPNGALLFVSWRGSQAESRIAVASLDGKRNATLDLPGALPIGVVDGHLIYLGSGALTGVPFDTEEYRVTNSPVALEEETRGNVIRAAVSPSGVLVYRRAVAIQQIMRVSMLGTRQMLIGEERTYGAPRYSPDGKRVAIGFRADGREAIGLYDIASSTMTRLTTPGSWNQRPSWTPDGKRVLFVSDRGGRNELWWQSADLSDSAQLVESLDGGQVNGGVIARDSTLVYWVNRANDAGDIWYRQLAGDTARRPLAVSEAIEVAPAVSADGKWVAYVSNQDEQAKVYVQPLPPTGARYQVTATDGVSPVWAPDGSRIFYVSGGQLHAAHVQLTPSFAVLSRGEVFEGSIEYNIISPLHAYFDVSRDWEFALLRSVSNGDLVVVHGLQHELPGRARGSPLRE